MRLKHIFTAALATLMLGACSNEELVQQTDGSLFGNIPEGMTEYQFKITGVTPTHISYATPILEADEMAINNVHALIFEQSGDGAIATTDKLKKSVAGVMSAGNKMAFLLPKGMTFTNGITKLAFVIVANKAGSTLDADLAVGTGTLTEGTSTYQDVCNAVKSNGKAGANKATNGLLMVTTIKDQPLPSGTSIALGEDAKFRRPFTRFDVKNEAIKSLKITGLKVVLHSALKAQSEYTEEVAIRVAGRNHGR